MNKIIDSTGNLVVFGDDFLITEVYRFSTNTKDLALLAAGRTHILCSNAPMGHSFAANIPGQVMVDFSKLKEE